MGAGLSTPPGMIAPDTRGSSTPSQDSRKEGPPCSWLQSGKVPEAWREGHVPKTVQPWCGNGGRSLSALGQCHSAHPHGPLEAGRAWSPASPWSRSGEDGGPQVPSSACTVQLPSGGHPGEHLDLQAGLEALSHPCCDTRHPVQPPTASPRTQSPGSLIILTGPLLCTVPVPNHVRGGQVQVLQSAPPSFPSQRPGLTLSSPHPGPLPLLWGDPVPFLTAPTYSVPHFVLILSLCKHLPPHPTSRRAGSGLPAYCSALCRSLLQAHHPY